MTKLCQVIGETSNLSACLPQTGERGRDSVGGVAQPAVISTVASIMQVLRKIRHVAATVSFHLFNGFALDRTAYGSSGYA